MLRRISGVVLAAALIGGGALVGVTPVAADEPLTIAKPNPGGPTPYAQITLPEATRGTFYSFQMTALGGVPPYTWSRDPAHSSPMDPGLSFSPAGVFSGTPTVGDETGSYIEGHEFVVTDSAVPPKTATISTRLTIQPFFRITTAALPNAVAGQPYAAQLAAKGGQAPFKFSRGSALPKGLKFAARTGVLHGSIKWGGQYPVTINVEDGSTVRPRFATKTFLLTVAGPTQPGGTGGGGSKPIITATGDLNCAGGVSIKATGSGSQGSGYISAKIKGKLSCTGSTGHPSVRVTGAKVVGAYYHQGPCSIMGVHSHDGGSPTLSALDLAWKTAGGKAIASQVRFSSHDAKSNGWQLPATNPPGSSQVTGSYAGVDTSAAFIVTAPSSLQGLCAGAPAKALVSGTLLIRF